jgi:hypothetical protein
MERGRAAVRCRAGLTGNWDKPYWVKSREFMACVDKHDFECRDSKVVLNLYSAEWFTPEQGDLYCYYLPTFYLENGHALFINGRHRTALLSKHLDLLPMALMIRDENGWAVKDGPLDEGSQITFKNVLHRELALDEIFVLPDMPLNSAWREE